MRAGFAFKSLIAAQNALLAAVHAVLFGRGQVELSPRRVLVLRTAALGDFVMTIPALTALRAAMPGARITLLTTSTTESGTGKKVTRYAGGAEIFPWLGLLPDGLVDDFITWPAGEIVGALGFLRSKVARLDPDSAFILQDVAAPCTGLVKKLLFLRVLGVRSPVHGWRVRATRGSLAAQRSPSSSAHHVFGPLLSVSEHPACAEVARLPVRMAIQEDPAAEAWASKFWAGHDLEGEAVVALAVGSVQFHKRWPIQKFAQLVEQLAQQFKARVIVIGTLADRALGEELRALSGAAVLNVAGEASILEAAALLRRCALVVGNDGGAAHLAAAVDRRVVTIIPGIEVDGAVDPWGNDDLSVRRKVPCSPCYSFTRCPKGHMRCMQDVSVADVMARCVSVLA